VRLTDCVVAEGAIVEQAVAEHAEIGAGSVVGPFASLPPGSQIAPGRRTGAFYTASGSDDDNSG
jgi:bifunctional UDP-N-acetylglucosamine pyrophosphorylase/glucosamine-1-phosphate N-acetyltransferase